MQRKSKCGGGEFTSYFPMNSSTLVMVLLQVTMMITDKNYFLPLGTVRLHVGEYSLPSCAGLLLSREGHCMRYVWAGGGL